MGLPAPHMRRIFRITEEYEQEIKEIRLEIYKQERAMFWRARFFPLVLALCALIYVAVTIYNEYL